MSNDLEQMFAEADQAEVDETMVDESLTDNSEEPDEVPDEPDEVEEIEPEIEAADDQDNTDEVPEVVDNAEMETIIIDGEEVRVTKQELRDGYLRRADYSKKTAEAAAVKRKADWADQIQSEFERDPEATVLALAQAYKIPLGQPAQNPNQPDPYEDMDPDVAIVLRRMEEQEARHQAELRRIEQQTEGLARKAMVDEVKFELDTVKADFETEFGEPVDEMQLLEVAMAYNLPLAQAADLIGGQLAKQQKKAHSAAAEKAAKAAEARKTAKSDQTAEAKRVATGVIKGSSAGESSGDVSVDDFNNIEDLFELLGA